MNEKIDEELYEELKYQIWCLEMLVNPKYCETTKNYKEFIQEHTRHFGDCTLVASPCPKCQLNDIEIKAQNMLDCLKDKFELSLKNKIS